MPICLPWGMPLSLLGYASQFTLGYASQFTLGYASQFTCYIWAQWKISLLSLLSLFSPFSPLNILLSINGQLLFLDLTDLTMNGCNFQKFNDQCFKTV